MRILETDKSEEEKNLAFFSFCGFSFGMHN